MEIPILYEDADLLVIDKPAGLIVHSDGRTEEPSVAEWMAEKYPESRGVGEPWTSPQGAVIERTGIVHRLDRTTSGALVLAKTAEAYQFLKEQFQARSVEKGYRAFVYGTPPREHGVIEAEIVRIRSLPPRWGVARDGEGKKQRAAITAWKVLARGEDDGQAVAYLDVHPKTGRTHQIRVHLKHLNHSIVCDPLYSAGRPCLLGFARPALHAHSLSLTLPSGERREFVAPLPADFETALARIGASDGPKTA
jgi:23S rRNA pseudouridine1911/1915/1917 synthase